MTARRKRKDLGHRDESVITSAFHQIRTLLVRIVAVLLPVIRDTAKRVAIDVGLPMAREIVADLMDEDIPGEEKRGKALERLREAIDESGEIAVEEAGESILNWLIETAVNELKSKQTND